MDRCIYVNIEILRINWYFRNWNCNRNRGRCACGAGRVVVGIENINMYIAIVIKRGLESSVLRSHHPISTIGFHWFMQIAMVYLSWGVGRNGITSNEIVGLPSVACTMQGQGGCINSIAPTACNIQVAIKSCICWIYWFYFRTRSLNQIIVHLPEE